MQQKRVKNNVFPDYSVYKNLLELSLKIVLLIQDLFICERKKQAAI